MISVCDAMTDDDQLPERWTVSQAFCGVRADVVSAGIALVARWAGTVDLELGLIGVVVLGVAGRYITDIGGVAEPDRVVERSRAARVLAIGPLGTRRG